MNGRQTYPRKLNLLAAARLRCPRCGEGRLFRGWFQMNKTCEVCGFEFEREQGFFLGSIYFNYGVSAVVAGTAYTMLTLIYQFSPEVVLGVCLAFTVLFPVWFFRYARSAFLAVDYYVHPQTKQDLADDGGKPSNRDNPLSAAEMASHRSDDAAGGMVVGMIVVLALLFGLALIVLALVAGRAEFMHR